MHQHIRGVFAAALVAGGSLYLTTGVAGCSLKRRGWQAQVCPSIAGSGDEATQGSAGGKVPSLDLTAISANGDSPSLWID